MGFRLPSHGFLFEPGNVDDLAEKLTRVLSMSEDKLQALKRESLRIVESHDIQRTLDTFENLYRGEPVDAAVSGETKKRS